MRWVWRAWQQLDHERRWIGGGMAPSIPGRIPWTAMLAWCRHHRRSPDDLDFLAACMAAMDEVFIDWWLERQRQAT